MADTENQNPAPADKQEGDKAPWGDDFDAERAWKLVQNLRTEVATLKTENGTMKTKLQASEDEGKTELQKLQERLAAAEQTAKEKERELSLAKVLRKHPELEEFADLLTGDTEEELAAKAERLAAIGKGKKDEDDADKGDDQKPDAPELPGKPQPNLTPGHGGEDSTPFDPTAIALAARK
ncbi:scaffolding protein [Arthrobacter phage Kaylissa]|uniref:Scaffolding protein n=1 Tax=Arthrobacter phage Kaylissa TaxID=2835951 RepID=A0AA92N4A6_9CAUD|nr:head scaffolding protein [Arthrobacter phage Kaylissa]QXO14540.1 scaffolding protein [Arthrobacter phage Kaylissa]